jgi:hypothetical protein
VVQSPICSWENVSYPPPPPLWLFWVCHKHLAILQFIRPEWFPSIILQFTCPRSFFLSLDECTRGTESIFVWVPTYGAQAKVSRRPVSAEAVDRQQWRLFGSLLDDVARGYVIVFVHGVSLITVFEPTLHACMIFIHRLPCIILGIKSVFKIKTKDTENWSIWKCVEIVCCFKFICRAYLNRPEIFTDSSN